MITIILIWEAVFLYLVKHRPVVGFRKRGDFQSLVEQGEREFDEDEKKDLLK